MDCTQNLSWMPKATTKTNLIRLNITKQLKENTIFSYKFVFLHCMRKQINVSHAIFFKGLFLSTSLPQPTHTPAPTLRASKTFTNILGYLFVQYEICLKLDFPIVLVKDSSQATGFSRNTSTKSCCAGHSL